MCKRSMHVSMHALNQQTGPWTICIAAPPKNSSLETLSLHAWDDYTIKVYVVHAHVHAHGPCTYIATALLYMGSSRPAVASKG